MPERDGEFMQVRDDGRRCFEPAGSHAIGHLTTPTNPTCDITWHVHLVTAEEHQRVARELAEAVRLLEGWRNTNDYPAMRALFAKHADAFLVTITEGDNYG